MLLYQGTARIMKWCNIGVQKITQGKIERKDIVYVCVYTLYITYIIFP